MKTPTSGTVPGFSYEFAPSPARCSFCEEEKKLLFPTMLKGGEWTASQRGICETCCLLASWVWGKQQDPTLLGPFATEPSCAFVVVAREDEVARGEFDVLMVGRKDDPGAFGLPGGKLEAGEAPKEAACRELFEETGVATWPQALEHLHTGYTTSGCLSATYLARGYSGSSLQDAEQAAVHFGKGAGTGPEGTPLKWQRAPLASVAGLRQGYMKGIDASFVQRLLLRRESGSDAPLSLELSEPAQCYLERRLSIGGFAPSVMPKPRSAPPTAPGRPTPNEARMLEAWHGVMGPEERAFARWALAGVLWLGVEVRVEEEDEAQDGEGEDEAVGDPFGDLG